MSHDCATVRAFRRVPVSPAPISPDRSDLIPARPESSGLTDRADFDTGIRRIERAGWTFVGLEQREDGIYCLFRPT